MSCTPRIPSPTDEIVTVGWDGASKPMLRFRDELHLPDHLRSIVATPPPAAAPARPAGWRPTRGERVSMISWATVPVGGDPYRGEGVVEYVENAVAVVRLPDGKIRGFNVGDVSPAEISVACGHGIPLDEDCEACVYENRLADS